MKKLYRDPNDRRITGLCAGVGQYLDIDPSVVRLVTLVVVLMTWLVPGTLAYLLASLVVPMKGSKNA